MKAPTVHDVAESERFYNGGILGKSLLVHGFECKFRHRVRLKP